MTKERKRFWRDVLWMALAPLVANCGVLFVVVGRLASSPHRTYHVDAGELGVMTGLLLLGWTAVIPWLYRFRTAEDGETRVVYGITALFWLLPSLSMLTGGWYVSGLAMS